MAAWDPDAQLLQPLDYRLVCDSFVTMFWKPSILQETLDWLTEHAYDARLVDASKWSDEGGMHRTLAATLDFPEYYGRNMDALNDCLGDVAALDYGVRAGATGLVLAITNFEAFTVTHGRLAHQLLNVFEGQARSAALIGHRMICLVQSNDPQLSFDPIGATSALWNDAEWSNKERGL